MNKRSSSDDNLDSVRAFIEEGIAISLGVILGYPGEDEGDQKNLLTLLEYVLDHNLAIMRTYRESYKFMGFRSIPLRRLPLVGVTALPLFLKPPSDIYRFPDKYGIKVAPFGNEFKKYRSLPERVKSLVGEIPRTFVAADITANTLYDRLLQVKQKSDRAYFSSYAQLVHSYFSSIQNSDRFFMVCEDSFSTTPLEKGLTYRSLELDTEISTKSISHSSIELFKRGATFKEFVNNCTPGTKSAVIEAKHLVAMAALEGSLFLKM
jgi:hypothetical protein